jgi:hypothetical protein
MRTPSFHWLIEIREDRAMNMGSVYCMGASRDQASSNLQLEISRSSIFRKKKIEFEQILNYYFFGIWAKLEYDQIVNYE